MQRLKSERKDGLTASFQIYEANTSRMIDSFALVELVARQVPTPPKIILPPVSDDREAPGQERPSPVPAASAD